MLDRAISITNADRGLLLEAGPSGSLRPWLARSSGSINFPKEAFFPSQTALAMALQQQSAVITEDLRQADGALNAAQSVIVQRLRAVVAIPLYSMPRTNTEASMVRRTERRFSRANVSRFPATGRVLQVGSADSGCDRHGERQHSG